MARFRNERRLARRNVLRGIQDRLRGTIIIAQGNQLNVFIVIPEIMEIFERRALKTEDRLLLVADDKKIRRFASPGDAVL